MVKGQEGSGGCWSSSSSIQFLCSASVKFILQRKRFHAYPAHLLYSATLVLKKKKKLLKSTSSVPAPLASVDVMVSSDEVRCLREVEE